MLLLLLLLPSLKFPSPFSKNSRYIPHYYFPLEKFTSILEFHFYLEFSHQRSILHKTYQIMQHFKNQYIYIFYSRQSNKNKYYVSTALVIFSLPFPSLPFLFPRHIPPTFKIVNSRPKEVIPRLKASRLMSPKPKKCFKVLITILPEMTGQTGNLGEGLRS